MIEVPQITREEAEAAERYVTNGAQLLNARFPAWAARIELRLLNMVSTTRCVLSQAARRPFHDALPLAGLHGEPGRTRIDQAALLGFTVTLAQANEGVNGYPTLQALWTAEITAQRLAHDHPADGWYRADCTICQQWLGKAIV
jgi:hypothetical protein